MRNLPIREYGEVLGHFISFKIKVWEINNTANSDKVAQA